MEIITPDNEAHWLDLRKTVLTSTETAALFNLSPYMTYAELWYRKKGLLDVAFEESTRMRWGKRLESAIAHGIAEDLGYDIRPKKEFHIDLEKRLGASFDFEIIPDGLLEIKNVDSLQFKEKWDVNEEGDLEAPPHIEIQGQHQLLMDPDKKHVDIGAFIGGNEVKLITREPDEAIQSAIRSKASDFWASIDANQPPEPNFEEDADLICKLYGYAEPGKVLFFQNNTDFRQLAFDHKMINDQMKELELRKDALKAHMLSMIGDAESVKCGDFSVTAGVIGECDMAYTRSAYRNFRINWPRKKKQ